MSMLAVLLFFIGSASAQSVTEANYKAFFDGLAQRKAFLQVVEKRGSEVEETFLGRITKTIGADSLANRYGSYGSPYGTKSIFNAYGRFGSKYSNTSPFNPYATNPPMICYKDGNTVRIVAYLTRNKFLVGEYTVPKINPDLLLKWLGREEDIPD